MVGVPTTGGAKVPDSPHEITVCLDGTQQGEYADKFIMAQDHSALKAWGWSSVGAGGLNVGRWMMTTMEFSNGGPLKRDVSVYPYCEINNSILTGELGMGSDGFLEAGEEWTKTCGPWFNYVNHVPAAVSDAKTAAAQLFADAQARAEKEAAAWPYTWFKHPGYLPAAARGTVTGRLVIKDAGNPRASAAGMWVGLTIQPHTYKGFYDFQKWLRPFQFWVKTDADGTFSIPHVHPGEDYDLWAFGPGTAGTFLSHALTDGSPLVTIDLPAKPFKVAVKAGSTTSLGDVVWTPSRVGPTVFEIGIPNRKSDEFRHGDDYWLPARAPKLGFPTPVWGGQMEFPLDFPTGMTYAVGTSQWPIDWNYVLPAMADTNGDSQPCSGTVTFDLAQAPVPGALASLYLACAGNDGKSVVITVNGTALHAVPGATGFPVPLTADGYCPQYSDTSSIHFSDHGPFCDERLTFPSTLLRTGRNELTITMNTRKTTAFLMVDYLRLEMTGFVPSSPRQVTSVPGNGRVQVRWNAVPGAVTYQLLRTTAGGTAAVIQADLSGPVCGSGMGDVIFTDTSVTNGTQYTYAVVSVNGQGSSAPSPTSPIVMPASTYSSAAAVVPQQFAITKSGHHLVALQWKPNPESDRYTIWRSTMVNDGVGGFTALGAKRLASSTATTYEDRTASDGRMYEYHITAENAVGSSMASEKVRVSPVPTPPASAPTELTGVWKKFRDGAGIVLAWKPVPGATGYTIYRRTTNADSFTWPDDFRTALLETTYFDMGNTDKRAKVKGLDPDKDYWFQVSAVNAGGVSPAISLLVPAKK